MSTTRATTKGPAAMPAPGSSKAPTKFTGEAQDLKDFIEEFENCADAQELTSEEKVKMVAKYVDRETKRYWKTLDAYAKKDWGALKKELLKAYPGAEKGHRFSVLGLRRLAQKQARKRITSENDLVKYYQHFQVMSAALKADNKLTDNEVNRYFWFGIHQDDRRDILTRLENQDRAFDRKTVPTMQKAVEAGRVVFCDEAMDLDWDDPIAEIVSKDTKRKKKIGRERREVISSEEDESSDSDDESDDEEEDRPKKKTVRQEVQTKVVARSNLDDIEELAKRLRGLDVGDVNYAGTYARLVVLSPAVASAILSLPPQPMSTSAAASALPIQPYPHPNQGPGPATYPNNVPLPQNNYRTSNATSAKKTISFATAHMFRSILDYRRSSSLEDGSVTQMGTQMRAA
ncbi:hypothetical protein F5876DRAFT_80961 [Lentinula aff. lateritia]|uniref:Uncharacterized protein n=1 Tax=Lentinula aff. lateritia TaxID=2804960 RepID=A0ACC1TP81_9AGAR|nr:hypothetical protein F5876DRAFT_80961 [Lentinula aff. lateritia]